MLVTPTLHFYGQCEEAIGLYQKAFGLQVGYLLHYADADPQDWDFSITTGQRSYVYHAEAYIGTQRMMLADEIGPVASGNPNLVLTITFETDDLVKEAYETLKEGGSIIQPLRTTTYSSSMASVVDRFGFRWGLMTEG
ncbi:VOC family protein [Paenibacillus camerounensis]|uniref:VOC family protein n=1 Tax=Paenibacillus camerounensis TaxID=1243663 RepID=UPI0005A8B843|nr:VOC family protein [Paenibacillus camerounensis]